MKTKGEQSKNDRMKKGKNGSSEIECQGCLRCFDAAC